MFIKCCCKLQNTTFTEYRIPSYEYQVKDMLSTRKPCALCTVHYAMCTPDVFISNRNHSKCLCFILMLIHSNRLISIFFCDYHSRRLTMTIKMFKCSIICNFMHLEMKSMKNTSNFEHCTISAAFSHNFQISIHYWRRTFHQGLKFNTNTNIINHL